VPGGAEPSVEGPFVRNSPKPASASVESAMETSTLRQSTMEGMRYAFVGVAEVRELIAVIALDLEARCRLVLPWVWISVR